MVDGLENGSRAGLERFVDGSVAPPAEANRHGSLRSSRQFSSYDWRDFLKAHNLEQSMSRRGNCHDNAVAESFFQLLKRERIRRRIYANRDEARLGQARQDIFDYIEMFYNPKRQHSFSQDISPVEYEKQYFQRPSSI